MSEAAAAAAKNYYVAINGEQLGPLTHEQVQELINSGSANPQDFGWAEGLADWQPLSNFAELTWSGAAFPADPATVMETSPEIQAPAEPEPEAGPSPTLVTMVAGESAVTLQAAQTMAEPLPVLQPETRSVMHADLGTSTNSPIPQSEPESKAEPYAAPTSPSIKIDTQIKIRAGAQSAPKPSPAPRASAGARSASSSVMDAVSQRSRREQEAKMGFSFASLLFGALLPAAIGYPVTGVLIVCFSAVVEALMYFVLHQRPMFAGVAAVNILLAFIWGELRTSIDFESAEPAPPALSLLAAMACAMFYFMIWKFQPGILEVYFFHTK